MLGVVLAGGRSRRMGRTKALIEIDGTPMAARVADALRGGGCERVVVVGGVGDELAPLGLPVIADLYPGAGPLGGVITALELVRPPSTSTEAAEVFVAPCDLPALSAVVVRSIVKRADLVPEADVVVARTERLEPALAIWRTSGATRLREMFDEGERALHRAMGRLRIIEVSVEPPALRNVNVPVDLVDDPGR